MSNALAIVSAADTSYFDLLQGLVCSIRDKPQGAEVAICVFDIGLTRPEQEWLMTRGVVLRVPKWPHGEMGWTRDEPQLALHALLERSRMMHYFPGYEIYMWIDADAWVQSWDGVQAYVDSARRTGFCAAVEADLAFNPRRTYFMHYKTFSQFGEDAAEELKWAPPLNAGVFAGRADAPHWLAWRYVISNHVANTQDLWLFDQTALNMALRETNLPYGRLPARFNWICLHRLPKVADDGITLVEPFAPHSVIGIVHAAGSSKRVYHALKRVSGGVVSRRLAYESRSALPAGDYVSPNFALVMPDREFPEKILGDRNACPWLYLRREVPHNWYVDRRIPTWGFVSRDEASILYNTALLFRGKKVLEIGCLMGWSACHLALAGIELDVVDPLLTNPEVFASVQTSLVGANPASVEAQGNGRIVMVAEASPEAVHKLARHRGEWSLFFIDGDHEGDAPLRDTMACEQYAAADAAMLFHDLSSPAVAAGLFYLHQRGWKVKLYHTAQIMGVAWRGNVEPVHHIPDPNVNWTIPDHLLPIAQNFPETAAGANVPDLIDVA